MFQSKYFILACLPFSVTLSSCTDCPLVPCAPELGVSVAMANEDRLPAGRYQLMVSADDFAGTGECLLPLSRGSGTCPTSTLEVTATFNGFGLYFNFGNYLSKAQTVPFTLTVDGTVRKTGTLPITHYTAGQNCGTCQGNFATVSLP